MLFQDKDYATFDELSMQPLFDNALPLIHRAEVKLPSGASP